MTGLTRPRGRLPARVYWTRRLLVVAVAFGLVFGIARLLQSGMPGGSDDSQETVTPVGGSPTATTATGTATADPTPTSEAPTKHKKKERLPQPDGPCSDADVVVTPWVRQAHVGEPVEVVLEVSTRESPACLWEVSPDSVFVTISKEGTQVWSSQQCTGAVPTEEVVARQEKAAKVRFDWRGRESDASCSTAADWVLPGTYTIAAVARGATDPQDTEFVLGAAVRPTVTKTPTPTETPTQSASPSGSHT